MIHRHEIKDEDISIALPRICDKLLVANEAMFHLVANGDFQGQEQAVMEGIQAIVIETVEDLGVIDKAINESGVKAT